MYIDVKNTHIWINEDFIYKLCEKMAEWKFYTWIMKEDEWFNLFMIFAFLLFFIFYFSQGLDWGRGEERVVGFGNFTQLKTKELSEISKPYIYIYIYTQKICKK